MYKQLNMGSGERTKVECFDLIQDLIEAFHKLSSVQQSSMHHTRSMTERELKEEKLLIENDIHNINDTAVKIFMKLTGTSESYINLHKIAAKKLDSVK